MTSAARGREAGAPLATLLRSGDMLFAGASALSVMLVVAYVRETTKPDSTNAWGTSAPAMATGLCVALALAAGMLALTRLLAGRSQRRDVAWVYVTLGFVLSVGLLGLNALFLIAWLS